MRSCVFFFLAGMGFGGTIDQSFTSPYGDIGLINECCAFTGQTYTAGLSGTLAGISVDVSENSAFSFPLDVQIRTVSGGLPTTTIIGETAASLFGLNDLITFPQNIVQTAGVQYAIVVDFLGAQPEGGGQSVGAWLGAIGNSYSGGVALDSTDGGNTWPIVFTDIDSHFVTFVNTTPEPASLPVVGCGLLAILTLGRQLSKRSGPNAGQRRALRY